MLRYWHFFIFIFLFSSIHAQNPVIDSLNATLNKLTKANKTDSAYVFVMNFTNRKDISNTDKFYGNYAHSQILSANGVPRRSLKMIMESMALIEADNPQREALKALAHNFIGDNYFTLQNYDSAKYYCNLAKGKIDQKFKSAIALNYEILGYCYYLEKSFSLAIENYQLAIIYRDVKNNYCNANTINSKIGQCYLRLGNEIKAKKIIDRAIQVADSCGHIRLRSASRFALIDFYTYKKMYKEAYEAKQELDKINHDMEDAFHKIEVEELAAKYQSKLKDQENTSLLALNENKSLVISNQKRALAIAIVSIIGFLVLTVFVVKTSRQRRKLNEALKIQKQRTDAQNRELERQHVLNQKIFSLISHDFKGPMLSLSLLLDSYKLNRSTEMLDKYLPDVKTQLGNVNDVLTNLLDWAKTEIDIKALVISKANLSQITTEILYQLNPEIIRKQIQVNINYREDIELQMPADILRIAIRNILTNAIKYSFENGSIDFDFNRVSNQLIISDKGIGMNTEKADKLFKSDVMSQLGTKNEAGFGIGLYIVSELLYKYHGHIKAQSKEKEGSQFIITFPS
jgi:two-component system, sensor histidine kinase and response regulator